MDEYVTLQDCQGLFPAEPAVLPYNDSGTPYSYSESE
jgi:hypothetical protein